MSFLKFGRARSPPSTPSSPPDDQGKRYPRSNWETSATLSPPSANVCPVIDIQVPLYGAAFLTPPEDALIHSQTYGGPPVYDLLLHGVLQIEFPDEQTSFRIRCRRIIIGFRAIAKLDLGPSRLGEEDVILERKVVIEPQEGITLDKIRK